MSSQEEIPSTTTPPPKFNPSTFFNNQPSNLFDLINRLTGRTKQSIKGDEKTPPYYTRGTRGFMDFNKLSTNEAWRELKGFDPSDIITKIKETIKPKINNADSIERDINHTMEQVMKAFEVDFEILKKKSQNMFTNEDKD